MCVSRCEVVRQGGLPLCVLSKGGRAKAKRWLDLICVSTCAACWLPGGLKWLPGCLLAARPPVARARVERPF
jgi:hypothetical protein